MIGAACALAAVTVTAGWMIASSYIALRLGRIPPDALAQPWLAWWTYATSNPSRWTKVILFIAAIPPTGVIALLGGDWVEDRRPHLVRAVPPTGNESDTTVWQ